MYISILVLQRGKKTNFQQAEETSEFQMKAMSQKTIKKLTENGELQVKQKPTQEVWPQIGRCGEQWNRTGSWLW